MQSLFELGFFNKKKDKEENKITAQQLEDKYDKKYNAFCLSVSKYGKEKLANLMDKKIIELKLAQDDLKESKDKDDRVELKIKIDYLKNIINRCRVRMKNMKDDDNK